MEGGCHPASSSSIRLTAWEPRQAGLGGGGGGCLTGFRVLANTLFWVDLLVVRIEGGFLNDQAGRKVPESPTASLQRLPLSHRNSNSRSTSSKHLLNKRARESVVAAFRNAAPAQEPSGLAPYAAGSRTPEGRVTQPVRCGEKASHPAASTFSISKLSLKLDQGRRHKPPYRGK